MDYAKESLKMHYELKGKIEVVSRAKVDSKDALSLAYTPGVAQPCLEIQKDINKSYELTRRWNTVAVVTDGTAVLGLGDIGPEAGMPVMEGKCVLFKEFGDVGVWFAASLSKGSDLTSWINKCLDTLVSIVNFKPRKPKMKVHYGTGKQKDYDYNARKKAQSDEIDRILDKLKKSGYESLTTEEKKSLFDASKR